MHKTGAEVLRYHSMAELFVSEFMTPTSRDTGKEAALTGSSLSEPLDSLSIELSRISAEIQSINSGFQAQIQQALAETRTSLENEYRVRFEKSVEEVREQARLEIREELTKVFEEELAGRVAHLENQYRVRLEESVKEVRQKVQLEVREQLVNEELNKGGGNLPAVQAEIERVTAHLESIAKEIAAMLDDPAIELCKVIRKRTEQAELRAYLNGLRYSIADQSLAKGAGT